jgi:hypothetical protein
MGGEFVFANSMIKKILQNRTKIISAFEENASRITAF